MSFLQILAEGTTTQPTQPVPWWATPTQYLPFVLIGVVALFMLTSSKSKRTEESKRLDMLKNLKRGDRVQTIGGVFGTVVDAREADVVLKVDESSNTKIKFAREAIKRVVTDEEPAAK